ncbi:hypothetical protein B484DRAFT_338183, partial [Ochromonadaceae sp. CCMP2298]
DSFHISMMQALWLNQPTCLCTYLCPPCFAVLLRHRVLEGDMSRYSCCQGYFDSSCFRAGCLGESRCPRVCLATEACCCLGPSVSASRMSVMDQHSLQSDPCDNRIIRLTNCLMLLGCLCDVLSICFKQLGHCKSAVHHVSNCIAYTTIGCMTSQVLYEIKIRQSKGDYGQLDAGGSLNEPMLAGRCRCCRIT